jgi:BirA family biotin operon repressor/biotin-[acetyl-CoA-carboxylase] ligase
MVVRFMEIDSTSGHARSQIGADRLAPRPIALVAKRQIAGVGRFGRRWESPEGGLWMTLAWPCVESGLGARLEGLGLRVGVACLRVVRGVFEGVEADPHVRLKWPNDVLIHGRKALGVLTEVVHGPGPERRPWILVGVGINANVSLDRLPEAVRSQATTLERELGRAVDLGALERSVLAELRVALEAPGLSREVIREAGERLHGLGRETTVSLPNGARVSGVLTGLNDRGMAVLDVDGRVYVPPLGAVIANDQADT